MNNSFFTRHFSRYRSLWLYNQNRFNERIPIREHDLFNNNVYKLGDIAFLAGRLPRASQLLSIRPLLQINNTVGLSRTWNVVQEGEETRRGLVPLFIRRGWPHASVQNNNTPHPAYLHTLFCSAYFQCLTIALWLRMICNTRQCTILKRNDTSLRWTTQVWS